MKHDSNELFSNLVIILFSNATLDEFTKQAALFFMHYMPLSDVSIFSFTGNTLTKMSMYYPESTYKIQEKIIIPETLMQRLHSEVYLCGNMFETRIYTGSGDSSYSEVFRMVNPEKTSSLHIPLDYDNFSKTTIHMSIHSFGENVFTPEHVALCERMRSSLSIALSTVLRREKEFVAKKHETLLTNQLTMRASKSSLSGVDVVADPKGHIETLDEHMASYIKQTLKLTNGRIGGEHGAAQLLGLPTSTLWSKLRKLHIEVPRERRS